MSYIAPNSDIYILRGIPFDETYQHTVVFNDPTIQFTYFAGKLKYRLRQQSYQRAKRGYIRVQVLADNLYDCNYVMFRNTAYGDKWFYAFILDATYINDNVSEIHYMIDVMQTWMFDYQLNPCFVEREHTVTDNIGDNLVPEGLELGDYVIDDKGAFPNTTGSMKVVLSTTEYWIPTDPTLPPNVSDVIPEVGQLTGGVYSGTRYHAYSTSEYYPENQEITDLNRQLQVLTELGKSDAIVGLYMIPSDFCPMQTGPGYYVSTSGFTASSSIAKPYTDIGGYLVKNKKLFTSPYQMLGIDTGSDVATFEWEYFDNATNATLDICSSANCLGEYIIVPTGFKGATQNVNEAVTGNAGVQCSYNIDGYLAWKAQNQYVLAAQERVMTLNLTSGVVNSLAGGLIKTLDDAYTPEHQEKVQGLKGVGNTALYKDVPASLDITPVSIAKGAVKATAGVTSSLVQYANANEMIKATKNTAKLRPRVLQGSVNPTPRITYGKWRPLVYNIHIRPEFAKIIDGYFTRYGYACHQFKVPTTKNRPHWTYLKTVDCSIKGVEDAPGSYIVHNIPNDDATTICSIYNSGITFWRNASEVGNYTLDNSPA